MSHSNQSADVKVSVLVTRAWTAVLPTQQHTPHTRVLTTSFCKRHSVGFSHGAGARSMQRLPPSRPGLHITHVQTHKQVASVTRRDVHQHGTRRLGAVTVSRLQALLGTELKVTGLHGGAGVCQPGASVRASTPSVCLERTSM